MNKAVMLSIHPKYCEMIASGKKTVEIRKNYPQFGETCGVTPFKAYIYCTMQNTKDPKCYLEIHGPDGKCRKANGKVIGEFTCDQIEMLNNIFAGEPRYHQPSIGDACLSMEEIEAYGKGKRLEGWHIMGLRIFEEPKKLEEFAKPCPMDHDCGNCPWYFPGIQDYDRCEPPCCGFWESDNSLITRPPQSWCYVEELQ